MTDEETIAWVTAAAEQHYAAGRVLSPPPHRPIFDGPVADLGDYLEDAARVMLPGRSMRVHRDDDGVRLVLL